MRCKRINTVLQIPHIKNLIISVSFQVKYLIVNLKREKNSPKKAENKYSISHTCTPARSNVFTVARTKHNSIYTKEFLSVFSSSTLSALVFFTPCVQCLRRFFLFFFFFTDIVFGVMLWITRSHKLSMKPQRRFHTIAMC